MDILCLCYVYGINSADLVHQPVSFRVWEILNGPTRKTRLVHSAEHPEWPFCEPTWHIVRGSTYIAGHFYRIRTPGLVPQ